MVISHSGENSATSYPTLPLLLVGNNDLNTTQIVAKRGVDYLLRHGPKVHGELRGMSARDATLHFIKESCRLEDVPVIFYRLQKVRGQGDRHGWDWTGAGRLGLTQKMWSGLGDG